MIARENDKRYFDDIKCLFYDQRENMVYITNTISVKLKYILVTSKTLITTL